tara:strand:- start:765 stop:992 length:228 start_codon:yes stop_codon:yes gene_type:complete
MNENEEFSYEEEQLQLILMNELREKQIQEERQIKQQQDKEYQESLIQDENNKIELKFEEVSIEQMRRIRLQRFSK